MKTFSVPIFGCRVGISTKPCPFEARNELQKFIGAEIDGWEGNECYVVANRNLIGLWCGPKCTDALLAHECVHVAEDILESIASSQEKELEEIRATLVGYVFEKVKNALETKSRPKKKTA